MGTGAREHMRADVAAEGEDGGEVGLEDEVPVGVGEGGGGVAALDPGAVEEDGGVVGGEDGGG